MKSLVLFAHGKESGPWGSKIRHLASVAERHGATVISPDYSHISDPDERVKMLLKLHLPEHDKLIMVGSSMGGYVSMVACNSLKPVGLFLMAPAFYIPGYAVQEPSGAADHTLVVHGWQDDIIPVEHSIRYSKKHLVDLYILNSDHRLNSVLPKLGNIFDQFLVQHIGTD